MSSRRVVYRRLLFGPGGQTYWGRCLGAESLNKTWFSAINPRRRVSWEVGSLDIAGGNYWSPEGITVAYRGASLQKDVSSEGKALMRCERVESVSNVVWMVSQHGIGRRRGRGSLLVDPPRIYNVHVPLSVSPHFPCGLVGIFGFRPLRCCIKGWASFVCQHSCLPDLTHVTPGEEVTSQGQRCVLTTERERI